MPLQFYRYAISPQKKIHFQKNSSYSKIKLTKKKQVLENCRYEEYFKSKVTLHKTGKKKSSFETTFIRFLAKFPNFLYNHTAYRGNYCNTKLIYRCQRYTAQRPVWRRTRQPHSVGPLPLQRVNLWVYNDGEAMIYVYHYEHLRHIDSGPQWANELLSLIIVLFSFSLPLNFWQSWCKRR